jgi:formate hydrogenlyase transcriptional activator
MDAEGFGHTCVLPLMSRDKILGILATGKREGTAYTPDEIGLLTLVSSQVAMAVDKATVCEELRRLKDDFGEERVVLKDEIRTELHFAAIVGRSAALQRCFARLRSCRPPTRAY